MFPRRLNWQDDWLPCLFAADVRNEEVEKGVPLRLIQFGDRGQGCGRSLIYQD